MATIFWDYLPDNLRQDMMQALTAGHVGPGGILARLLESLTGEATLLEKPLGGTVAAPGPIGRPRPSGGPGAGRPGQRPVGVPGPEGYPPGVPPNCPQVDCPDNPAGESKNSSIALKSAHKHINTK